MGFKRLTAVVAVVLMAALPQTATAAGRDGPGDIPSNTAGASYLSGIVMISIDGVEVSRGFEIGLCQQDCLGGDGSILAPATGIDGQPLVQRVPAGAEAYEFEWPPVGSYQIALRVPGAGTGYLMVDGSWSRLVPTRADATSFQLTSCVEGCRGQNFYVRMGREPRPPARATYDVKMVVLGDAYFGGFDFTVMRAVPSTRVKVQVVGCGGKVVATRMVRRADRTRYSFHVSSDPRRMGRQWKLVTTIREKGREPGRSVYHRFGGRIRGFSCAGVR